MFCRRAWQRIGPLARSALKPTSRTVPVRHMAFGVPGGSTNMAYFVLCGGGLTAAVVYAYKAVNGEASTGSAAKESVPELLTAIQVLAGSTAEIAAASVGDGSLIEDVQMKEEDDVGLGSTLESVQPEVQDAITEVEAKEVPEQVAVVNEELESAADAEAFAAEGEITEETSTPVADAAEEEPAASLPEEPTAAAPTVEEVEEVEAEDQALVPEAAPEEAVSSTEASPDDAAPAEDATTYADAAPEEVVSGTDIPPEDSANAEEAPTDGEATSDAEAAPVDETSPAAGSVEEEAAAEALLEETVEDMEAHSEAGVVVKTIQLAAASSGSDLEILTASEPQSPEETKHCHSCHSAPSLAEEVAPPVADGEDMIEEAKEADSLVEGQTTETMAVVSAQ